LSIVAIWPFLSRPGLPQETDAELHIFRLHELSHLVRGGELYPRWAPNFYHGYGYPLFNYYAPLTYYLGLAIELWPWFDAVDGVKAVFVLGLLLAGLAMYGFVRDHWGRGAGFVAAVSYLYSPYILYIDPHARGVLAESFSFALFPLVLWSLSRLARKVSASMFVVSVLATGALILTHNLMALLFFGLLTGWLIWTALLNRNRNGASMANGLQTAATSTRYRHVALAAAALILGLGVAAFFWVPVFLEREAVNLDTLLGSGDNFDFRTHFLSWQELLAAAPRLDWSDVQPAYRAALGIPQWILGSLGIAMIGASKTAHRRLATFFAFALALLLFLMLPASTVIWERISLLPFFQFPWRLLGAAAAMLAILSGFAVDSLSKVIGRRSHQPVGRWQVGRLASHWLVIGVVVLLLLFAMPLTQPAPWPAFGEVSTARMSLIELHGRWLGTTSTSDFVPAEVAIIPKRNGEVVAGIFEGRALDRVNRAEGMIPAGAVVTGEEISPLRTRYTIETPEPFLLRLFQFYFPGWVADIDGDRSEIEVAEPEGFVVVPIPAGDHIVDVYLASTPSRTLATGISTLSLIGMLVGAVWLWRSRADSSQAPGSLAERFDSEVAFSTRPVAVAALVMTAVTLLVVHPLGWWRLQSAPFTAEPAGVSLEANVGDQVALIGYDTSSTSARAGEEVEIVLYWQAFAPMDINYQVFLHLMAEDGSLVSQSDKLNPGHFPTKRWPLDRYIRDAHTLTMPTGLAPAELQVRAGLWVQDEGWRLPVLDANDRQIGDTVPLFSIRYEG
jgi:hypothetical protein